MSGLVLELQSEAMKSDADVSSLLLKVKVVSKKLGLTDIEEWVSFELNGYPDESCSTMPNYREVLGAVKVHNPVHGLIDLRMSADLEAFLSRRNLTISISELTGLLKSGQQELNLSIRPDYREMIMSSQKLPMEPFFVFHSYQLVRVLDAVKSKVLDWALDLEAKGIVGEGMSFSEKEKETAQTTYITNNNIGSMSNSQLQQHSTHSAQTQYNVTQQTDLSAFVKELREALSEMNLAAAAQQELAAEVQTLESQLASPKPKPVIINESLKSTRAILEGITGSVLATGLLQQIGQFF